MAQDPNLNAETEEVANDEISELIDLDREQTVIDEFIAIALGDKYDDIGNNGIEWTSHKTNDPDNYLH